MSLNKFVDAERSLPLGLEGGFKKLIVDELVVKGASPSSKFRSSATAMLFNNITPQSMFPTGFGSLTLPEGELVEGSAYEACFQGVFEAGIGSQVLFVLRLGDGASVPCGSLQYTWASGSTGIQNFKVNVKLVAFFDFVIGESIRSYVEFVAEDGSVVFKGSDNPQVTLPFDQVQDLDFTMTVTNVVGTTEFVVQSAELNRVR